MRIRIKQLETEENTLKRSGIGVGPPKTAAPDLEMRENTNPENKTRCDKERKRDKQTNTLRHIWDHITTQTRTSGQVRQRRTPDNEMRENLNPEKDKGVTKRK